MQLSRISSLLKADASRTCAILGTRNATTATLAPEKQPLRRKPGSNITYPVIKNRLEIVSDTIYGSEKKVGMRSARDFFPSKHKNIATPIAVMTPAQSRMWHLKKMVTSYYRKKNSREKLIQKYRDQYEDGRRILAKMMGIDSREFTEKDVDEAIEYFFPSGLGEKNARPFMKPPEYYFPKVTEVDMDDLGRPTDLRFYTFRSVAYGILSDIGNKTVKLIRDADEEALRTGRSKMSRLMLHGSKWLSCEQMGEKFSCSLDQHLYAAIIEALDYLSSLPNAGFERDFIYKFRNTEQNTITAKSFWDVKKMPLMIGTTEITKVVNGVQKTVKQRIVRVRTFVKRTDVEVVLKDQGTGKYTIDGHSIGCYRSLMARENFLAPLILTDKLGKVDIEARTVLGPGGLSVLPRAVRHGVSLCILRLFPGTFNVLNFTGLLTRDPRYREREKINQKGADAKWVWISR